MRWDGASRPGSKALAPEAQGRGVGGRAATGGGCTCATASASTSTSRRVPPRVVLSSHARARGGGAARIHGEDREPHPARARRRCRRRRCRPRPARRVRRPGHATTATCRASIRTTASSRSAAACTSTRAVAHYVTTKDDLRAHRARDRARADARRACATCAAAVAERGPGGEHRAHGSCGSGRQLFTPQEMRAKHLRFWGPADDPGILVGRLVPTGRTTATCSPMTWRRLLVEQLSARLAALRGVRAGGRLATTPARPAAREHLGTGLGALARRAARAATDGRAFGPIPTAWANRRITYRPTRIHHRTERNRHAANIRRRRHRRRPRRIHRRGARRAARLQDRLHRGLEEPEAASSPSAAPASTWAASRPRRCSPPRRSSRRSATTSTSTASRSAA